MTGTGECDTAKRETEPIPGAELSVPGLAAQNRRLTSKHFAPGLQFRARTLRADDESCRQRKLGGQLDLH